MRERGKDMNKYEVRYIFLADSLSEAEYLAAFHKSPVFEFTGLSAVRDFIGTTLHPEQYLGIKGFRAKWGYMTYIITKKA